ncbi:MAG: DinB family protein [Bacteroidota bacterium]|nr:DinB family protein [Bacteroidota bacterium]
MFRTIDDFLMLWNVEKESTLKMFRAVTEKSLDQKVYSEGRTLARLLWHITGTLGEMPQLAGLQCPVPTEDIIQTLSLSSVVQTYERSANDVAAAVKEHWTDAMLLEEVPMYGEQWKRGEVLASLILHQTHHRAQMTVLMRQAGLKVPGVYGPAKEEWSAMGMTAEE